MYMVCYACVSLVTYLPHCQVVVSPFATVQSLKSVIIVLVLRVSSSRMTLSSVMLIVLVVAGLIAEPALVVRLSFLLSSSFCRGGDCLGSSPLVEWGIQLCHHFICKLFRDLVDRHVPLLIMAELASALAKDVVIADGVPAIVHVC